MPTSESQFVTKLDQLLDESLNDPELSIDRICLTMGLSRSQLHRVLKEHTSLSTSRYIRHRRLLKARHLLINTDLRISEICDQVGITNYQNFSTYFAEEFSVNPSDFRKTSLILPQPEHPELATSATGSISPTRPDSASPRHQSWSIRSTILAAGLVLLMAAGGYLVWKNSVGTSSTNPVSNSLAVMPFYNLSGPDSNPACKSIMDNIHTSVSLINNLKVIARSSSDQYEGTSKSVWQIGNELGVANVLRGNFLKIGDRIQLKIEILGTPDTGSGEEKQAWHKTYSAAYQDIFKLTDEVVADVARQLNLSRSPSVSENLRQARTQNVEAYNDFLQGRQLLISRMVPDLLASLPRFDQALALDSTFAEVWAQKAVAYHLLLGSGKMDNTTLNRLTEENALQAIRLDPTSSTAYGVLGSLYYSTYQWQAAENAFRIALQHNPNDAQVNHWYALLLRTTGRVNEAVYYSTQAITLDPLHPIFLSVYISNCSLANRFDLAQEGIKTGQGLFDRSFAYQMNIAHYWLYKSDYGRAVADFRQALVLNPDDRGQVPILMYCEAKRGNHQQARLFIRQLTATTPRSDYERAVVYAGLEQADSSMYYLKKAADGGYFYRDTKVTPVFEPYRKTLTYRAVLRRYNLAD